MKRRPVLAFGALVVAAGVSVGAFFAAKNKKDKDDQNKSEALAENQLFNFENDAVKKVSFSCTDGDYTVELNDESEWVLTEGGDFAIDQSYVKNVCTYACQLKAEDSYENDESKLAEYGLDKPETIELFTDDDSYKIYVGTVSPTQDYYYISVDGKDKVFTIDSLYGSVLRANHIMLRSKKLIPYKNSEIKQITVKKGDEVSYDFTHSDTNDTWSLPPEYSGLEIDQTKVHSLALVLTKAQAALENMRDEDPSDLKQYGLDKPTYTATIKATDGTERNILVNSSFDPENGCSSLYIKETGQVMIFVSSDIVFFERNVLTFITTNITNAEITDITGFDLKTGDLDIKAEYDGTTKKGSLNGKEFDLIDSPAETQFKTFFESIAKENIEAVDVKAKPELKDPVYSAVIHKKDGSDFKYDLTDAGSGKCYVFVDGKYTGALVSSDILSGINSTSYFYKQFIEEAGLDK